METNQQTIFGCIKTEILTEYYNTVLIKCFDKDPLWIEGTESRVPVSWKQPQILATDGTKWRVLSSNPCLRKDTLRTHSHPKLNPFPVSSSSRWQHSSSVLCPWHSPGDSWGHWDREAQGRAGVILIPEGLLSPATTPAAQPPALPTLCLAAGAPSPPEVQEGSSTTEEPQVLTHTWHTPTQPPRREQSLLQTPRPSQMNRQTHSGAGPLWSPTHLFQEALGYSADKKGVCSINSSVLCLEHGAVQYQQKGFHTRHPATLTSGRDHLSLPASPKPMQHLAETQGDSFWGVKFSF